MSQVSIFSMSRYFVLLALPTGASIEVAARFLEAGARVIDLGAAFRLQDRDTWERVYGQAHAAWSLAHEAVYGAGIRDDVTDSCVREGVDVPRGRV